MTESLFESLGFATGGGVATLLVKTLWDRFLRRSEADADAGATEASP